MQQPRVDRPRQPASTKLAWTSKNGLSPFPLSMLDRLLRQLDAADVTHFGAIGHTDNRRGVGDL